MIGIFILTAVLVVLFMLWVKAKVASKKTAEQRSAIDTILVSIFVRGRKNVEDTAYAIRTPEISKEEAIQKTKDAIKELDADFKSQMRNLISTKSRLEDQILPSVKTKPGIYLGKSQSNKRKFEKAMAEGNTDLANSFKENAIMFLDLKKKATERIDKCEKQIKDISTSIDKSSATYESRKAVLDDILMELETTITGNLSAAKFNTNMEVIQSLRRETADKLRDQNAAIAADNMISGSTTNTEVASSDYEDEFNNL